MSKDLFLEILEKEMIENQESIKMQQDAYNMQLQYQEYVERNERLVNKACRYGLALFIAACSLYAYSSYNEDKKVEELQQRLEETIDKNELLIKKNRKLVSMDNDIDLNKLLSVYKEEGVSDAENWVCVAILESGWNLDSELMTQHRNPIGMGVRPYHGSVQGADMKYAKYPSIYAQARDLIEWIKISPRKKNELFHNFLIRRGYNLNPAYFIDYSQVVELYKKQS